MSENSWILLNFKRQCTESSTCEAYVTPTAESDVRHCKNTIAEKQLYALCTECLIPFIC